ncbi:jumonji C domain-containing protein 5 isoform X4 [Megachile rotundata]|uniref:jumonji C domain-containing protein 5 isoform X4 n=1 Tax=Megachile rotundata TaxID=143995 RepID=UPI0006150D48|nr:PREDICTED: lysine-specific demethylase 8-like isoform X4 [Megachile rotundata]
MCNHVFIAKLIPWDLLMENIQNSLPIEMKIHLSTVTVKLKNFTENKINPPIKWIENSLILIEACLDRTWEILNSGYWQSVPIEYRYCYSLCVILKAVVLEFQYESNPREARKNIMLLKNIVQQVDKGFTEITRYNEPSMELFYKTMFMPQVPAILTGCIKHWKALDRWQDLSYLSKIAGNRIVPIEIGSRYTDEDWSQQLFTFSEFLQKHILKKNDKVGYLAQHQLFDQIPELKEDFMVPEYCSFTDNDSIESPDINAWFGPEGTVSPLHFDPKHNLLCQVFGYKRVILYHPNDSSNLYPYDTKLLNNTAQVDPLSPNYEKWPEFSKAKGWIGYLKPGEMLYIPPKWWHHVTSLSPSFSISFWWN